ncbi:MAG: hypothetical protein EBR28_13360 [Planctomycetia bacterium]|nr:hypothetical protein [Planctomycetia bacterium]
MAEATGPEGKRRGRWSLHAAAIAFYNCDAGNRNFSGPFTTLEWSMGVKKTGKGRRKLGQKKRRMRARIRHRKG